MVGFSKNQLCLSAQNRPHAWPVAYRLTTDTDIVAISNVDNTVVIGTEAYPYMATGTDPATYSMSKLEVQQACVAKRSIATITGLGVVFASPDGLIAVQGPGQVRNLTENIFTRRQWQDLGPENIRAVVHDDIYFFWTGDGSSGADTGYALDMKPTGFGLIRLNVYANAMYADPLTDKLYLSQVDAPPPPADWLVYSVGSDSTPCALSFNNYEALGTPVPWLLGSSASYGTAGDGEFVHIPLNGPAVAPTLVEGVDWFPDVPGTPAPTFSTTDPSSGVWSGYTWVMRHEYNGLNPTTGGFVVLTGTSGNTIITFVNGFSFYTGASYEYTAA